MPISLRSLPIRAAGLLLALLACVTVPAQARSRATPTPAPTPTPVADPAISKLARQQFVAWQAGAVNKSLYAAGVVVKMDAAKVQNVSRALAQLGPLTDMVYIGPFLARDVPPSAHGYIYQMRCAEGSVYQWMILDGDGKIATIFFKDKLDTETIEVPATAAPSPTP